MGTGAGCAGTVTHWDSVEAPAEAARTDLLRQTVQSVKRMLAEEVDRYILWSPVLIAAGAVTYFSLSVEPSWPMVAGLYAVAAICAVALYRTGARWPALIICLVASGFLISKTRTEILSTPVLASNTSVVTVSGWVEALEFKSPRKQRALIRVIRLEPWTNNPLPEKLRISLSRKTGDLAVGSAVSFKAKLFKPRKPISPGAFDFARRDWFRGIGGSGYGFGEVTAVVNPGPRPFGIWLGAEISNIRTRIANAVKAHLQGDEAAFAVAILTGLRGGIPDVIVGHLRAAGLAHLLAISGLHMGLIAFSLFSLVRALFALSERAVLELPIKKWAAVLALLGATAYLLVSGAAISTQRAYIMVTIMLLAIIVARPAISMHNLALAAILLLVWQPESVLNVSFQMSFLSVVALIALYEKRARIGFDGAPKNRSNGHILWRARRVLLYIAGIALSTLVAGLATGPIAAYHFNRVAVFGMVANLIAIPLMALVIMPLALVGVLLIPFGMESVPFALAGWGITLLLKSAEVAANIPGSIHHVPSTSAPALLAMVVGMLWFCLWRTRLRWFGAVSISVGLAMTIFARQPDILIDQEARVIAVRTLGGRLVPTSKTAARFAVERWLSRDGDSASPAEASSRQGMVCDREGCIAMTHTGKRVAWLNHASALWDECGRSDIVITSFSYRGKCGSAKLVIDRYALYRNGAHAVYLTTTGFKVVRVVDHRGHRPWSDDVPISRSSHSPNNRTETAGTE